MLLASPAHSAAVARARSAFPGWSRTLAQERAAFLQRVAQGLRDKTERLAVLLTKEGGKPLRENRDEVGWCASAFDYYAGLCRIARGRVIPSIETSQLAFVLHEPYGVVGAIVPWNYPLLIACWKLAQALAAGNTVVLKPSSQTPLTVLELAKIIFDAGASKGKGMFQPLGK